LGWVLWQAGDEESSACWGRFWFWRRFWESLCRMSTDTYYMERKELRHDRHTVSLLTNHTVFSPKYRGKILVVMSRLHLMGENGNERPNS
jgi:hypothetical protein